MIFKCCIIPGHVDVPSDRLETFSDDLRVLNVGSSLGKKVKDFSETAQICDRSNQLSIDDSPTKEPFPKNRGKRILSRLIIAFSLN